MPKKTWFQHDINCHQKEKLSLLIARGGYEAYGRFWGFVELWYSMQLHKEGHVETMNISESVLLKHLQMNRRSLPKLLQLFHESLGIVFRNISETYPIVYQTTWNKSLNFINKRFQKKVYIDKDIENKKENKSIDKELINEIYNLYPTTDPATGKATGKSSKDKDKIEAILREGKYLLKEGIEKYVQHCVDNDIYLKNFKTFLNNPPDIEQFEEAELDSIII